MIDLTELEKKVMEAARETDFGDCLVDPQWSFAVCDASGLPEKTYRGVVASLVKKELVRISDQEGRGRSRDMVFAYTEAGREYMRALEGKDNALRDAVARVLVLAEKSNIETCGLILSEEEREEVLKDGNAIKIVRRELGSITTSQGIPGEAMGRTEMLSHLEHLENCIRDILDKKANDYGHFESMYVTGDITTKAVAGLDAVVEALRGPGITPSISDEISVEEKKARWKEVIARRIQEIIVNNPVIDDTVVKQIQNACIDTCDLPIESHKEDQLKGLVTKWGKRAKALQEGGDEIFYSDEEAGSIAIELGGCVSGLKEILGMAGRENINPGISGETAAPQNTEEQKRGKKVRRTASPG